jgi:hypothetical protein
VLGDAPPADDLAPADADHAIAVCEELVDREPLAHLGARRRRRLDDHAVEGAAARTEPERHAVADEPAPGERAVAEVGRDRGDRRTAGAQHTVQQPELREARRAALMDEMAVRDLARERGPVHQQHVQSPARQHERRGRACAPGTDDDRVTHDGTPTQRALLVGRSRRDGLEQAAELLDRVVVQQASVADSRDS